MLLADQRLSPAEMTREFDVPDDGASLTPSARGIYQLILRPGGISYDDLPRLLGSSSAECRRDVNELVRLGLVLREGRQLRAVPHHQAVDALLAAQNQIIREALRDVSDLQRRLSVLAKERAWLGNDSVGTVVGASATGEGAERRITEVRSRPNVSLAALHPGARFSDELLDNSLRWAEADIARGVRLRAVHQSAALSHRRSAEYLYAVEQLGGQVRLRDNLPFRLIVVDGESAVCCLEWQDGTRETLLLQGAYVLNLLARLFETIWMDAVPLGSVPEAERMGSVGQQSTPTFTSQQEAIMRHLAEGATDLAIAKSLGITTRTVTRRITEIYQALGVQSRFQAGVMARRMGLV